MEMTAYEMCQHLDGARIVRYDIDRCVLFVWRGGHGINGYMPDPDGSWREVLYWNCGDYGQRDADPADVRRSMRWHMEEMDEEEYWSFC